MSDTPDYTPSTPTPTPAPALAGGLRPPVSPTPPVGLTPPVAPSVPAPLRAPLPRPPVAPAFSTSAANIAKLPERRAFVSPMPEIEDDSIPSFLPIVAGFAAAVAIAFAVLLFLKQ